MTVCWDHEGDLLIARLDGGPCNEIGTRTVEDLERMMEALEQQSQSVRALILCSENPNGFCAGADLRELHANLPRASPQELESMLRRIHGVFNAIDMMPCLTIAATHGVVFGGGFELALTCDVIIADRSSRFAFPELRLGLVPGFGGMPRLSRDVGNAALRDLLFTGRSIRAERAHELGIVSQLVARGEAISAARNLAEQAARFDRGAMTTAKAFIKKLPEEALEKEIEAFVTMFRSPVVAKALESFVRRRDLRPYLPTSSSS